ncbi:hypothetical protein ACIO53_05195 [Streptomyces sp. NPDC087305]|uniref:hypothetical protein n=1 Tax=Streptomyces sp. NPDC087305 TaxID=3365781 RepID=UPI0038084CC1
MGDAEGLRLCRFAQHLGVLFLRPSHRLGGGWRQFDADLAALGVRPATGTRRGWVASRFTAPLASSVGKARPGSVRVNSMFSGAVVSIVDDVCGAGNVMYGSMRKYAQGDQVVSCLLPS